MNSAMIATEPLSQEVWDSIGWEGGDGQDLAHGFFYAQRTADGRIAIGDGRCRIGIPPALTATAPWGRTRSTTRQGVLNTVLPQTRGVPIAHGWCGVLAVPRTGRPASSLTRRPGSARPAATSATV